MPEGSASGSGKGKQTSCPQGVSGRTEPVVFQSCPQFPTMSLQSRTLGFLLWTSAQRPDVIPIAQLGRLRSGECTGLATPEQGGWGWKSSPHPQSGVLDCMSAHPLHPTCLSSTRLPCQGLPDSSLARAGDWLPSAMAVFSKESSYSRSDGRLPLGKAVDGSPTGSQSLRSQQSPL